MRAFVMVCFFLFNQNALAATLLQPLIDAAVPCATITLADGQYDDPSPVYIRKDVTITGSRNAIVHSEFQIIGGVNVHFSGFTLEMNKEGAPARNGISNVYPQNGMVVLLNSTLWADDLEVHAVAGLTGYALQKNAFHVHNGNLQLRSVTQFSRVDWRNLPWQVIELHYNSYANIFGPENVWINIAAATTKPYGAAIEVASSKLILSGANIFNCLAGCAPNTGRSDGYGIKLGRDAFVQVGAGLVTTIQYFTTPQGVNNAIFLDPTSRQWVCPTCTVN